MEDITTIVNIADTIYVRIPASMARYFEINKYVCKIEDTGKKTALVTFE